MTDPGAFVPIDTEYDIVVARTLTITATAASHRGNPTRAKSRFRFRPAWETASISTSTAGMLSLPSKMRGAFAACEALDFHRRYCWG